jgi:hypothetical protein
MSSLSLPFIASVLAVDDRTRGHDSGTGGTQEFLHTGRRVEGYVDSEVASFANLSTTDPWFFRTRVWKSLRINIPFDVMTRYWASQRCRLSAYPEFANSSIFSLVTGISNRIGKHLDQSDVIGFAGPIDIGNSIGARPVDAATDNCCF